MSGCWNVSYTDVSEKKQYNHFIGKKYEVVEVVYAYFVDESSRGLEPYIAILSTPRIGGPEIVSKEQIHAGTVLEVIGVERTNRVFECRTSLLLSPIESLKDEGKRYKTRLELMIGNEGTDCGMLNPKHYREIRTEEKQMIVK